MQNVAMFLRSVPNWEIVEPLPDVGEFFSISKELKEKDILSVQIMFFLILKRKVPVMPTYHVMDYNRIVFHSFLCSCIPQVGV